MSASATKYLQQRSTRRYLTREGGWTGDPAQAATVRNITEALSYCRRFGLSDMDIVLKFGSREEYDVRLEIGNEEPRFSAKES